MQNKKWENAVYVNNIFAKKNFNSIYEKQTVEPYIFFNIFTYPFLLYLDDDMGWLIFTFCFVYIWENHFKNRFHEAYDYTTYYIY